jgi:hypothetical protein
MTNNNEQDWATKILDHAKANWNDDGWDIIYETMGVKDIIQSFEESREYGAIDTYEQAFAHIDWLRDLWNGQRSEVQSTIW